MARIIPATILAKTHGQALLPPMLRNCNTGKNQRTAFLAVQYYLNHFPQGLGLMRKELGVEEAENIFGRLKHLMQSEKLESCEIVEAGDILNALYVIQEQNRK
jgi:hypothetical protein